MFVQKQQLLCSFPETAFVPNADPRSARRTGGALHTQSPSFLQCGKSAGPCHDCCVIFNLSNYEFLCWWKKRVGFLKQMYRSYLIVKGYKETIYRV